MQLNERVSDWFLEMVPSSWISVCRSCCKAGVPGEVSALGFRETDYKHKGMDEKLLDSVM